MTMLLNGEPREIAATTLAEALAELGFAGKVVATAVNGDFVAARKRDGVTLWPRATASRSSHRCRAAEMRDASTASSSHRRLFLGTAQYPSPAILAEAVRLSARRGRHRLAAPRGRRAARAGAGLLVADPRARRARAAQHRRLPHGQGGGDHGADGARGLRHALDQARGDRRGRHAAARCRSRWSRPRGS